MKTTLARIDIVRRSSPPIALPFLAAAVVSFSAVGAEKDFKFEVLSIKVTQRGPSVGVSKPTPNGFSANVQLHQVVQFAYGPPGPFLRPPKFSEMRNLPNWSNDIFAIEGRVSQADLKAWQSQGDNFDLLRSALRAALKERFQLAVHEEPAQRMMFELVIAKGGPRLKAAAPGAVLPLGVRLASGGVMTPGARNDDWEFHGATMDDLAYMLTGIFFDGPVRDRTGLTGRYDFPVPRIETPGEDRGYAYSVDGLGLQLKHGKESRPILVIDHVERPTQN